MTLRTRPSHGSVLVAVGLAVLSWVLAYPLLHVFFGLALQ